MALDVSTLGKLVVCSMDNDSVCYGRLIHSPSVLRVKSGARASLRRWWSWWGTRRWSRSRRRFRA